MGPLLVEAAGLMWGHVAVAGPGPGGGLGALRLPPWGTAERGRQLRRVRACCLRWLWGWCESGSNTFPRSERPYLDPRSIGIF